MALRSLDNSLPAALERPKKVPKVAASQPPKPLRDLCCNDENSMPLLHQQTQPKVADPSVEYIASEDLKPLDDPESRIQILLEDLGSKDWVKVCEALNDIRRLAVYHYAILLPILDNVLLSMVEAVKNPRSALCKTSIIASADIFRSFGHQLLQSTSENGAFDSLLLQLLLKASQDKRFVCEEAEKSLETMANCLSPIPLLRKLQSYVNHSNLRVRAKAAFAISSCVSKMGIETMKEFGLAILLQVAAELLSDRLPDAREAARSIVNCIYCGFTGEQEPKEEGSSLKESWDDFCASNLPPLSCQSVSKIVQH